MKKHTCVDKITNLNQSRTTYDTRKNKPLVHP